MRVQKAGVSVCAEQVRRQSLCAYHGLSKLSQREAGIVRDTHTGFTGAQQLLLSATTGLKGSFWLPLLLTFEAHQRQS